MQRSDLTRMQLVTLTLVLSLVLVVVAVSLWLARRNLRAGRGDRRGALRTAGFVAACSLVGWALSAHHVVDLNGEAYLLFVALGRALRLGATIWVLYMAVEPYVRRHWPHVMISWTRLLGGQWKDPLVGRDTIVGVLVGAAGVAIWAASKYVPGWLGWPPPLPNIPSLDGLLGLRPLLGALVAHQVVAVVVGMAVVVALSLLRGLVRVEWVAVIIVLVLIQSRNAAFSGTSFVVAMVLSAAALIPSFVLLLRAGLLPFIVSIYVINIFSDLVVTAELTTWQGVPSRAVLAVALLLMLHGFRAALAGRPAVATALLED